MRLSLTSDKTTSPLPLPQSGCKFPPPGVPHPRIYIKNSVVCKRVVRLIRLHRWGCVRYLSKLSICLLPISTAIQGVSTLRSRSTDLSELSLGHMRGCAGTGARLLLGAETSHMRRGRTPAHAHEVPEQLRGQCTRDMIGSAGGVSPLLRVHCFHPSRYDLP